VVSAIVLVAYMMVVTVDSLVCASVIVAVYVIVVVLLEDKCAINHPGKAAYSRIGHSQNCNKFLLFCHMDGPS